MGCHVIEDIGFSWPLSIQISRIIRRSNTLAVQSREDVARRLLFTRENFVVVTVFL